MATPPAHKTRKPLPHQMTTRKFSSQNWDELLSMDSNVSSSTESASSSLPSIGGIFGKNNNTGGGISIILILGIVLLVLGTGGIGFITLNSSTNGGRERGQIRPKIMRTAIWNYEDEDDGYDDYNEYYPPTNYRAKGEILRLCGLRNQTGISAPSPTPP